MHVAAAIAGAVLAACAWLSVLRTVFTPTDRGSLISRVTARVVGDAMLAVARRVPEHRREYLLGFATPLMLFLMAAIWLVGSFAGFTLFAWGLSEVSWNARALSGFYSLRSADIALPVTAWLSVALLLTAFMVHLVRVTSAYSRREVLVARLAAQATRTPDAETIFVENARAGHPHHLEALFREWANWLADVQATHSAYPALVHYRSADELCWSNAAQIMLDCAALAAVCAPNWAPPQTTALLNVGERCLPRVAASLGIELPPVPVSYQGREMCSFSYSLARIRAAGLAIEIDEEHAQLAFHKLRVRYAPYSNAICERLLYMYKGA
jgi:hypothetical protein